MTNKGNYQSSGTRTLPPRHTHSLLSNILNLKIKTIIFSGKFSLHNLTIFSLTLCDLSRYRPKVHLLLLTYDQTALVKLQDLKLHIDSFLLSHHTMNFYCHYILVYSYRNYGTRHLQYNNTLLLVNNSNNLKNAVT